ncbi:hypothetical protein [Nonomuraea basaltis]|uniref:hypothetical protein n=1 Tax=Nonomuraea basaltis TaxID=2495887 RepID=UPI00110C7004|nr:hypothetical protein [Nonomuraea basaltis]TMR96261.1 hypothetical protein EJK15_24185 [Nonomuraea basaltis]
MTAERASEVVERIAVRGLLAQQHTRTEAATGVRSITVVAEGNVTRARRRTRPTRAARRARRTGTDVHPRPPARASNKARPTPKRRQASRTKTFSRVPDRRTVPAPPPARPGRDSVRRARHPRHPAHRRGVQGLYAILTTGPASAVSRPPPYSPWEGTEAARHAPRPPGMPEILRQT